MGKVVTIAPKVINQVAVDVLESYLEETKKGEHKQIFILSIGDDNMFDWSTEGCEDTKVASLIMAFEFLKQRLLNQL